jgi:hypothetical protein
MIANRYSTVVRAMPIDGLVRDDKPENPADVLPNPLRGI